MGIRLDIVGLAETRAKLSDLEVRLEDFNPLWDMVTELMIEHETEWFSTEGEGSWPELKETYLKRKLRDGFPPDILIRTGHLLETLVSPDAGEVSQGRTTLGTFTLKTFNWGTDDPVAEYHQDGAPERRTHWGTPNPLPARPVLVVTPSLLTQLGQAQDAFLELLIEEAGLG